jgi:hypothetical protein
VVLQDKKEIQDQQEEVVEDQLEILVHQEQE